MTSLLSQVQLIAVSFLVSFFMCFIWSYIYQVYLSLLNKILRFLGVIPLFICGTYFYFKLCLNVYSATFSMYQILFLILGVVIFYKYYFPSFSILIRKRKKCIYKVIEKFKNTLYNLLKKMGGIFRGRSRKKRKENCADN